ncbi:MAG: HisA/HisF-related TIM barrel protein, partial [Pseudoxanthomonas sp.]
MYANPSQEPAHPCAGFQIIPAIDLRGGKVVRLYQGDYDRQTDYGLDPVELARGYRAAGAQWIHLVDLDGARQGDSPHLKIIERIARLGLRVQAGGGVRGGGDVQAFRDAGVERVVVGSLAVREPHTAIGWLQEFGAEHIVLALDTRFRDGGWQLSSAGWTQGEGVTLDQLAPHYAAAGARHVLCTDIDRDGTLQGPNLALYAHLRALAPALQVQVSGGVRALADVAAAQ